MTITVFHESDGFITYYADTATLSAPDIADQTPVGGGYILSADYPNPDTQYVLAGALADRPTVTVSDELEVDADGVDAAWFEAPSGTIISINYADSDIEIATGTCASTGLVVLRSKLVGFFSVAINAPFPYQDVTVSLNATTLGTPPDATDTPPGSPATVLTVVLQIPTPTGLAAIPKPKAIRGKYDGSAWGLHDHWCVTRYTNSSDAAADTSGTLIDWIYGEVFKDDDELTRGASYWYRHHDVDSFGNTSDKSAAISVTYRGSNSGDLEDDAGIPRVVKQIDRGNMVRDPDCEDTTLFTGSGGTLTSLALGSGTITESANYLYISAASGEISINTKANKANAFPVRAGKKYYASLTLGKRDTGTATYAAYVLWYSMDSSGVLTLLGNSLIGTHSTNQTVQEAIVTAPANARRAVLIGYKNSGASGDLAWYGPIFRKAASKEQIPDGDITEAKTDQTAPSVPTVALSGYGADFDADGTLDAGLVITATNPNTGVNIVRYVVEVHRSDTLGGTYSFWRRFSFDAEDVTDSLTTVYHVQANRRKFYKAKIRAIAFAGKKSAFGSLTTPGVQPSALTGYTGQSASAPTVTPIANGYRYSWSLGVLEPTLYKETEILVGGVSLQKIAGTEYTDMTARTVGVTPTITVKHYDKQGGATNVSSDTVAAAYRAAQAAEIGTGAITEPKIDAAAVTTPKVAPAAIVPSKLFPRDFGNLVSDPEMIETANFTVTVGSGALARVSNDDNSGLGPGRFLMEVAAATELVKELTGPVDIPVEAGKFYYISAMISGYPDRSTNDAGTFTPRIYVDFYRVDASGLPTVLLSTVEIVGDSTLVGKYVSGTVTAPSYAQVARLRFRKTRASVTTANALYVGSPEVRRQIQTREVYLGVVQKTAFNHIGGFALSNNVTDPTNDINIGAGRCCDISINTYGYIELGGAIIKRLDATWAAGTNQGGRDAGSIADGAWHVWVIKNPDANNGAGTEDVLFSLSATAPTMPGGYTLKRRIGSIIRASGAILAFKQFGNEFLLDTPVLDVDVSNQSTTAVLRTLTVPTGIQVAALIRVVANNASSYNVLLSSPDVADAAPSASAAPLATTGGAAVQSKTEARIRTNTSGQVRSRSDTSSTTLRIATYGWIDNRGQE